MKFRNNNVLHSFAKHFKKVREQNNLTQEELAYKTDISLSQIARIETARINPTLCTLLALAKGLNIHPKEFIRI